MPQERRIAPVVEKVAEGDGGEKGRCRPPVELCLLGEAVEDGTHFLDVGGVEAISG